MPASMQRHLPPERSGMPPDAELIKRRAQFTGLHVADADDIAPIDRMYGAVPCRVLPGGDRATVIYLHGGGYRMGSADAYTAYGTTLARAAQATVVLADYRLAPEFPFPAGLHDAASVYEEIAAETETPIILAGDSAGAGLATALTAMAIRVAVPPTGLALLSPWLDLRCTSPFYESSTDPLFTRSTAWSARNDYLQNHPEDDPLVSPALADLTHFPPTLIHVGSTESLLGDALQFTGKLAAAGVACALEVVAGQGHTWPVVDPNGADAVAAIRSFGRFVEQISIRSNSSRNSKKSKESARA